MSLIFQKTSKKQDFSKLNKLIYGYPKTGKSTLAAQMKDGDKEPLFICTEDGIGALEVYTATSEPIKTWEKLISEEIEIDGKKYCGLVNYLEVNKEEVRKKFSCIVVDLVSDLDELCSRYICKKYEVKSLADLQWGKGFGEQKTEFQSVISRLFDILPVTFITHTKEKELEFNGVTVNTQCPTMNARCLDFINGKVDVIGYIIAATDEKTKPALTFRPYRGAIAGSRFNCMLTQNFELDYNDMSGSYQKIVDHYRKGIK